MHEIGVNLAFVAATYVFDALTFHSRPIVSLPEDFLASMRPLMCGPQTPS